MRIANAAIDLCVIGQNARVGNISFRLDPYSNTAPLPGRRLRWHSTEGAGLVTPTDQAPDIDLLRCVV